MKILKTFLQTIRPSEYEELTDLPLKESASYFVKILCISFTLMILFCTPFLLQFDQKTNPLFDSFDKLTLTVDASQKQPFFLDGHTPLEINLATNKTTPKTGVLLTNETLAFRTFFFTQAMDLTGLSEVLAHKETYQTILFILLILLIPSMIILGLLWYLLKYALFILLGSFVTLVIARVLRYEIGYKVILSALMYATTLSVIVELVTRPLDISIPYIKVAWLGYLLTLILFSIVITELGYWDTKRHIRQKKRGYMQYDE